MLQMQDRKRAPRLGRMMQKGRVQCPNCWCWMWLRRLWRHARRHTSKSCPVAGPSHWLLDSFRDSFVYNITQDSINQEKVKNAIEKESNE